MTMVTTFPVHQGGRSQQVARVDPAACQLHYEEIGAEVPSQNNPCFLLKIGFCLL